MGDPQLDDGVANLERFNQGLAGLTPRLEETTHELAAHVTELQTATDELRGKLHDAQTALTDIEAEAGTLAGVAEQDVEQVGSLALDDVDAAFNAIDGSVRELVEGLPHELAARAGGMEADLGDLEAQGFTPLHESLAHLGTAYDGWTSPAKAALEHLGAEVQAALDQLQHDRELFDETDTFIVQHTEASGWAPVQQATYAVEQSAPDAFAQGGVGDALGAAHDQLQQQGHAAAQEMREQLAAIVHESEAQVTSRAQALASTADAAIDSCELVEHGSGTALDDATQADSRAARALDGFGNKIRTADGELQQIRMVVDAMDAP
jgi:hypothetical protein